MKYRATTFASKLRIISDCLEVMNKFQQISLLSLMLLIGGNPMKADDRVVNNVRQGTVRGRVVDNTQQVLPGASIYIESLHTGVTSDVNGFYTFTNLYVGHICAICKCQHKNVKCISIPAFTSNMARDLVRRHVYI